MPDTTRTKLLNHDWRGGTAIHRWAAVLFSTPFWGMGLAFLLMSVGVIPFKKSSLHAPLFVLAAAGGTFFAAGMLVLAHGCRGIYLDARAKKFRERLPDQPWLGDFPWNETRMKDGNLSAMLKAFMWFGFLLIFMLPFNWWGFASQQGPLFVKIIAVLFDLIVLWLFYRAAYRLLQFIKYGKSEIRFARFPFFVGEMAEMEFVNSRGVHASGKMTFTLRFVEEVYEKTGDDSTTANCYQIYAETIEVTADALSGGTRLPLRFQIPEGDCGTRLLDRPPKYWELEAKAATPGVDFQAEFLVPIYGKK